MRVIEVERIDTQENQDLDDTNIESFIEAPLIEPIRKFNEKGIKTLMSSCNKRNVNWITEDGRNVYTDEVRSDLIYKDIYSFGYGYAYVMLDFDSLSPENRNIMETTYSVLNGEINEEQNQSKIYKGNKRIIYGAVPSTFMVGNHEYDSNGFRKRPGMHFSYSTLKEDSLGTEDEFFLNNFDIIPTSTTTPRIVIVRYPVNEQTETLEVTDFFNKLADGLIIQKTKIDTISGSKTI